jgi:outer membrane protein TolC
MAELKQIVLAARSTAPSLVVRRWQSEIDAANADISRSTLLPSANSSASVLEIYEQRQQTNAPDRTIQALLYNVGISQPLFHWGALSNAYHAAKLQQAIGQRNSTEIQRQLLIDVRRRFMDLVISARSLSNAQRAFDALQAQKVFLAEQVKEGLASASALSTVEFQIFDGQIAMERQRNSHRATLAAFTTLIGFSWPSANGMIPEEIPALPNVSPLLDGSPSLGDYVSPRMANAEDAVRAERLNYKVAEKRLWPKLSIGASVNQDNRNPDNNALGEKQLLTTWSAGLGVNWSIFDGFATSAVKRSSRARIRQLESDRDQMSRQVNEEARIDFEKLQTGWKSLRRVEDALVGARDAIDFYEKEYAAGLVPKKTIDDARAALDVAVQAANVARADCYLAVAYYLSDRGEDPMLQEPLSRR